MPALASRKNTRPIAFLLVAVPQSVRISLAPVIKFFMPISSDWTWLLKNSARNLKKQLSFGR
jgi:hypothetical protein